MTTRTVTFPLGHHGEIGRANHRAAKREPVGSKGGVPIETVTASELVAAFRIEEPHGRGHRRYAVYLHSNRLWWPLFDPRTPRGDERRTLEDVVAGRVILFGDVEDEPAHTWIQRVARDLLVVDGNRLFAAGGAPVIVTWQRRLCVVNTGATRSGEPTTSGLALQPGHHGDFLADWAICRGKFWRGRSPAMDEEIRRMRCRPDRVPIIDRVAAPAGELPDFEVQTDSAYRLADSAILYRVVQRPTRYDDLLDLFARARDDGPPDLTARRLMALDGCRRILGEEWILNCLPLGCGRNVLAMLDKAPAAWKLPSTDAGLSDAEALAHA